MRHTFEDSMGAAPQLGQVFEHYRLIEKLGEGGMGVVFLAEDTRLGRKVAIKFLPPNAAADPTRRQRFAQEARAAAALDHPGIATVYELAESAGELYIVFEYVRGTTLRSLICGGGLAREPLLKIACDIAEALVAAHAAGIVHRDLKPENVMRTPEGRCKVLDFGIAKLTPDGEPALDAATALYGGTLTTAGVVVGTVGYMSPEQLEGKPVDFRCDIFSFGAMLYELAAGAAPFQAGSAASTAAAILHFEPTPLSERNPMLPPELERIVRKCLRKNRDDRYQSTRDMLVDLRSLKQESNPTAAVAPSAPAEVEEGENLFNTAIRRIFPTPRRWWEVTTVKLFVMQFPMIYLVWRIRQVAVQEWAPAAFLAMIAICIVHGILRAVMVMTAAAAPRELPQRARSFQPWLSLINYAQAAMWAPLALMLGFDRYPLGAPLMVAVGVSEVIWGVTEPMLARLAFPLAFAAAAKRTRI